MKKFTALLLCFALLCGCAAFAETAEDGKELIGVLGVEDSFTIKCRLPEGYKVSIVSSDATGLAANVESQEEGKPVLGLSIVYNDTYYQDGKALRLNDVSEEEMDLIRASLVDMLTDYEIVETETAYGTKLFIVKGHILDAAIVEVFSIYNAYEITVMTYPEQNTGNSSLTDEQIQMIVDFLSDMDFVPAGAPAEGAAEPTAESAAGLPAYIYPFADEDPVMAAVVEYLTATDFGYEPEAGGVLVPAPVILRIDMNDDATGATVYGNFWVFTYKLNGKILECTSGGENPGIIRLEKADDGWKVTSAEFVEDGDYAEDIARFAAGDKELEEGYLDKDSMEQIRRGFLVEYRKANNLDIDAYQDFGWDPVDITN